MMEDTEPHVHDVELRALDPEKQPVTGGGQAASAEENGSVEPKVPGEEVALTRPATNQLIEVAGNSG